MKYVVSGSNELAKKQDLGYLNLIKQPPSNTQTLVLQWDGNVKSYNKLQKNFLRSLEDNLKNDTIININNIPTNANFIIIYIIIIKLFKLNNTLHFFFFYTF